MATGASRIRGLRELNRAFAQLSKDAKRELRDELKDVGEPVRQRAEQLAAGEIRNIGPAWGRMRTGVTTKLVYVAPKARRRGGSPRPNFGDLLMSKAMEPALQEKQDEIVNGVERMLDRLADKHGF